MNRVLVAGATSRFFPAYLLGVQPTFWLPNLTYADPLRSSGRPGWHLGLQSDVALNGG